MLYAAQMSACITGYNMVKITVKRGNLSDFAPITIGLMLDAVRESLGSPVVSGAILCISSFLTFFL